LSTLAHNYEEWEPHGIVFEFRTTSSTFNGTSQALGTIIAATDYNPNDPVFTTKIEMEQSDFANSGPSCANLIHGIECAEGERPTKVLYVRQEPFSVAAADPRFTDLGNFQLATQGMSVTGVNLGELWVSYDITLYKKALNPPKNFNAFTVTSGLDNSHLFGTSFAKFTGSLGCTFSGNTITFPVGITTGRYLIWLQVIATSCALNGVPTLTGATLVRQVSTAPAGTNCTTMCEIDITTNSVTSATFTLAWSATSATSVIGWVMAVNPTFDLAGN
jgi:hypothetical protein